MTGEPEPEVVEAPKEEVREVEAKPEKKEAAAAGLGALFG